MDTVIIDAGTLEFNEADMTATGLLIPFGVPARSNLGTFTFSAGDVVLPDDYTGMSLNLEHKREQVVGGFSKAWEQPEGVMATFSYAKTDAGRRAFEEGKTGKKKSLSAEVAGVRIQGGKALPGALLFAAAQVEKPAFEGATLLAAEDTTTSETHEDTYTDENGVTWKRVEETTRTATADGKTITDTTVVSEVIDPAAAPAEDTTQEGTTMTASAVAPVAGAQLATTLLASAPTSPATKPDAIDLGTIFAAMSTVKSGQDIADAETLLAALSDITTAGLAGAGVLQPAWVGKLWQGKRYQRKYMDLATHTYGGIQLGGRKGFKLAQGTALVRKRGAEKTELPTGEASTDVYGSTRDSYGYAADVAQEWFDLEGGAEIMQAFWEGVVDSYAKITDEDALAAMFQVASKNAAALDRLIAPEGLPAGTPANSQYYPAVAQLIQAIEAITDANDDPSFAVVNPIAWKQLIYTPKDLLPEFVNLNVNVGEGTGSVAGKVTVQKAPQSFFAGTKATDPQIMAGAKAAIEFKEQGTTPIQIDAVDVAKHGLDRAIVGYLETFVVRPESLVLIGTKP